MCAQNTEFEVPVKFCRWIFVPMLFAFASLAAPAQQWEWLRTFPSEEYNIGRALAFDSDNHFFLSGGFQGKLIMGGDTLIGGSTTISYLSRFSLQGEPLWTLKIGDSRDIIHSIDVDQDNNVVAGGRFNVSLPIGDTTLKSPNDEPANFVAKFDAQGKRLWSIILNNNTPSLDGVRVCVDKEGSIYATGTYTGSTSIGDTIIKSTQFQSGFVAKLDSDGRVIWVRNLFGAVTNEIITDQEGNSILTGKFKGSLQFGEKEFDTGGASLSGFLISYNPDGDLRWAHRQATRDAELVNMVSVATDLYGNSFAFGLFLGELDEDAEGQQLTSRGRSDLVLYKFNSQGEMLWLRTFGGEKSEFAGRIACTRQGLCCITANYQSEFLLGDDTLPEPPQTSFLMAAFNGAGEVQWSQYADSFATANSNIGLMEVAIRDDGHILSTGSLRGIVELGGERLVGDTTSPIRDDAFLGSLTFPVTAVTDVKQDEVKLHIRPNPAGQHVTVSAESLETGPVRLEIVNLRGEIVAITSFVQENESPFSRQLSLENLAEGAYLLRLRAANTSATARFILRR